MCKKNDQNFEKFEKNNQIRAVGKKKVEYKCEDCHKLFKHRSNYYRHRKHRCKKRKQPITINNNIHNGDNIQNIQTNIQNNIIINNFGEENTDYISDELLLTFMNVPYNAIQKTSEEIHFNDSHPENKNIKLMSKKEKYVEIFIDGEWRVFYKNKIREKMMHYAMFLLNDVFVREGDVKLSNDKRVKFEKFQKDMTGNKNVQKFIKESLELLLLNEKVVEV